MPARLKPDFDHVYHTIYGESFKIVEYNNCSNVFISYTDRPYCEVNTCTVNIRNGNPPNPYRPVICGKGFHGEGYPISINNKKTLEYIKWHGMLSRCYGVTRSEDHARASKCYTDAEVTVDPIWFNYQMFATWFKQEMSNSNLANKVICLDSDLLNPRGNLYSENTCCLLPYELNIAIQLATKMQYDRKRNLYAVRVERTVTGQPSFVGRSPTESGAWEIYAKFKDMYIRDAYEKLQCNLPKRVEDVLLNFNCLARVKELGYFKI